MEFFQVFNPARIRLLSALCVAAMALTVTLHVTETSGQLGGSGGFGYGVEADYDHAVMEWRSQSLTTEDYVSVSWKSAAMPFSPIFQAVDFYIVPAGQADEIGTGGAEILFHVRSDDLGNCCTGTTHEFNVPDDQDQLSFVWDFEYNPNYVPQESTDDANANSPLGPVIGSSATGTSDLRYVQVFADSAMRKFQFGEQFEVTSEGALDRHVPFMIAEAVLAGTGLILLGLSIRRPGGHKEDGEVGRMVTLVQRGRMHLQGLLNLYILVGTFLLILLLLAQEWYGVHSYGFYDPVGTYTVWLDLAKVVAWLVGAGLWAAGLVNVIRSLRHYKRTQVPDLGGPVA